MRGPKNFCKEWNGWFYTMIYCCCWWLHVSLALYTVLGRTISCVWKPELCLWFAYFVFEYILGVHKTKFKESNFSFFTYSCWSWNINLFSVLMWLTGKNNNFFIILVDVNSVWISEIQSRSDYAGESILCSLSVYLEGEMCFETYYKTDKYAFSPRNVL